MLHLSVYKIVSDLVIDAVNAARRRLEQTATGNHDIKLMLVNAFLGQKPVHSLVAITELLIDMLKTSELLDLMLNTPFPFYRLIFINSKLS